MPAKTNSVSSPAEAASPAEPTPSPAAARYRVLPKGAGLIYTGACDPVSGQPFTFGRGEVVEDADPAAAAELEARGLVEILG